MIIDEKVTITWNNKHKAYYESKGYIFTKKFEEFEVSTLDLAKSSNVRVNVKCDYCGTIYNVQNVVARKVKGKHACKKCVVKKKQQVFIDKYGVDNPQKIDWVRKKTMDTCLEKYGTNFPSQTDIVKEKIYATNIERYGFKSSSQAESVKEKCRQTNMERYGVPYTFQRPDIIEQNVIKVNKTLYAKGTGPCSKPQKLLHDIIGGELNYPAEKCLLDIAYPDEMIYVEYNGSGHKWWDRRYLGEDVVRQKDLRRQYYLKKLGWKIIRVETRKDNLYDPKIIKQLINMSKYYLLNTKHSWVELDFDNNTIAIAKKKFKNLLLLNYLNML